MEFLKTQAIVLATHQYQDRHLVAKLLTREGEKVSTLIYGAMGGGSKKKGKFVEIGNVVEIVLSKSFKDGDLLTCKEVKLHWEHRGIRYQYKVFNLLCLGLQIMDKVVEEGHSFDKDHQQPSLYSILANFIFYLDQEQTLKEEPEQIKILGLFLAKLLHELGVYPNLEHGLYSERDLSTTKNLGFHLQEGTFYIDEQIANHESTTARMLYEFLRSAVNTKFENFRQCSNVSKSSLKLLLDYFLLHHQLEKKALPALSFFF